MKRIILAGGSGFLGQSLAPRLQANGWEVVVLTRSAKDVTHAGHEVLWDGASLGNWVRELNGATAIVNLAGRSVNCRYHAHNRRAILQSRLRSTEVLGKAIARCEQPPRVWLNSSTATIYKHTFDRPMDEATGEIGATPEAKDAFSVEVACAWERALEQANVPATRQIALRSAMVLGVGDGGVFRVLRRLARLGFGGKMGNGQQYVSWIHEEDFYRAIEWLIARDDLSGPVNVAAPNPATNREMMRVVREACGIPFGLPAAHWMLEIGAWLLRTETELIIKSRRVVPARLAASGFQFRFPFLTEAIRELESRVGQTRSAISAKFNRVRPSPTPSFCSTSDRTPT